jgi:hypothetical protein
MIIPHSKFLYTLFLEKAFVLNDNVRWTLKDFDQTLDGKVYHSLYLLYMDEEDTIEYNFAMKYFKSYELWEKLCGYFWFKPYIERWRKDLYLKLSSRALKKIIDDSKSNSIQSINSAKYLLAKGWATNERMTANKKKEIIDETGRKLEMDQYLQEDLERVKNSNVVSFK